MVLVHLLVLGLMLGTTAAVAQEPAETPPPVESPEVTEPVIDEAPLPLPDPALLPEDPTDTDLTPPAGTPGAADAPSGYVEGVSVEVIEERTEYSKTYANLDGTLTVVSKVVPVHWQRDGEWIDIDSSLVPDGDGFRSASNAWTVRFSPLPVGVTISTVDGDVTFSPVGAAAVAPELLPEGNGVIYRDAWPQADLVYRVSAEGVKEDIVLKAPPTVDRYEFTTGGRRFTYDDGALAPQGGEALGQLLPAEILDADGQPLFDADARITAVSWPRQSPRLAVAFDRDYLASLPAESYPIVVDPPWTSPSVTIQGYQNQNAAGQPHSWLRVGNANPAQGVYMWRTVAQFNYASALGHYVNSATVTLGSFQNGAPQQYWVGVAKANAWSWDGAYGNGWIQAAPITTSASFTVTDYYRELVNAGNTTGRLGFLGQETVGAYTYKAFGSYTLTMDLTPNAPSAPTAGWPTNGYSFSPNGVNLQAINTDSRSAYLGFQVWNAAGTMVSSIWCGGNTAPVMTAPGGSCLQPVPQANLEAGYTWKAFAYIPGTTNGGYSGYSLQKDFVVDITVPQLTTPIGWPYAVGDEWRPYKWNWAVFTVVENRGNPAHTANSSFSYVWSQNINPVAAGLNDTIETTGVCFHSGTSTYYVAAPAFPSNCAGGVDGTMADGIWYLHIKFRNQAGLWSAPLTFTHKIDTTAPSAPGQLTPTCATDGDPGAGATIEMAWDASAQDPTPGSGAIGGYSWAWSTADTAPATTSTLWNTMIGENRSVESDELADNDHWYFYLRALDNSNGLYGERNASGAVRYGPIKIENGEVVSLPSRSFAQFEGLWTERLVDAEWLAEFLNLPGIPTEIIAEGYHGLPEATRASLARCLAQELAGPDDDLDAIGRLLTEVIFNQRSLDEMITEFLVTDNPAIVDDPNLVTSLLDGSVVNAIRNFAIENLPPLSGDPLGDVPGTADRVVQAVASQLPADIEGTVARALAGATNVNAEVTALIDQITAGLHNDVTDELLEVLDRLLPLLSALDYRVCAQYENQPPGAEPWCSGITPIGAPVFVDVTGDGATDVTAQLAPALDPRWSGGVTVRGTLERFGSSQAPLRAHVWFVLDSVSGDRTTVGFDGLTRGDRLSERSELLVNLATSNGALDAKFDLSHDGPSINEWALSASTLDVSDGSFATGSVQFSPRSDLSGQIILGNDGHAIVDVDPAVPTIADLEATAEQTDVQTGVTSQVRLGARVDEIEDRLHIEVARSAADAVRISTDVGTGAVDEVTAFARLVADTEAAGDLLGGEARLLGVSGTAQVDIRTASPYEVHYLGTPVDEIDVTAYEMVDGDIVRDVAAEATDLPGRIDVVVTPGETTTVAYSADGPLGTLDIGASGDVENVGAVDLSSEITSIPSGFNLSVGEDRVALTDLTAHVGTIEALLSVNGMPATVLPGDHASLTASDSVTIPGTPSRGVGASVRVSGLEYLEVDSGAAPAVSIHVAPGGQRFEAFTDIEDATIEDHHTGSIIIDELPADAAAAIDPSTGTFRYMGDPIVGIEGFYQRPRLGPTIRAEADNVPARLTAHWLVSGDRAVIDYDTRLESGEPSTGSGALGVGVLYSPYGTGGDHPINGRYIEAAAEGLPEWAGVAVDNTDRSVRWDASDPTDLVRVTTRGLVTSTFAARATVTSVPASWDLSWGDNHTRFRALDGGEIGAAELALALDGHLPEPQSQASWATVRFDESVCDLDVSIRISGIEHIEFYGGENESKDPAQPSCFGGEDADGSQPVFADPESHPTPSDPIGAPTCLVDMSSLEVDPGAPTALCARVDIDLGGQPLFIDGEIIGTADEHGNPGEFLRRVYGELTGLPNSVRVVDTGDQFAVATSSPLGVQLTVDIGWRTAFASASGDLPTRSPGIHAIDFACTSGCRPETPSGATSPFCHTDTCYGIRIRANLPTMPTGILLDLTPNAYRVIVADFRPVDGDKFTVTAEARYMLDERVRLELTQHGVPDPVTLKFGPLSFVRCVFNDAGPVADVCADLEEETGMTSEGFRIALETNHSLPLGDLTLHAEIGDPASEAGGLEGDATIVAVPAVLDIDLLLGRAIQFHNASPTDLTSINAELACRSEGQETARALFDLRTIPASMDLRGNLLSGRDRPDPGGGGGLGAWPNDDEPPLPTPPTGSADAYVRFPKCGDLFPASTYPGGDPDYRGHMTDDCSIRKEVSLKGFGESGGGSGDRPQPIFDLVLVDASANTLGGTASIGGDFGLDLVDERNDFVRGPNVRVDGRRASVEFAGLRPGAIIRVDDKFGIRMFNADDENALVADELTMSVDLAVQIQRCEWEIDLYDGAPLAPRNSNLEVYLDGPIGATLSFDPGGPVDQLPGMEVEVDAPRGFELRTRAPFLGAGFSAEDGGYDNVAVRFHRPRLDIEIDLAVEIWVRQQPWSDFVDPLRIHVDETFTTLLTPVFIDDDEQDLIYTVNTDFAACRDMFVDPSMFDDDEVDRIRRDTEGPRTTGFETSDQDHSYSFTFLPREGSITADGEPAETRLEDWELNLIGATLIHPFPNPDPVRLEWGPICDGGRPLT